MAKAHLSERYRGFSKAQLTRNERGESVITILIAVALIAGSLLVTLSGLNDILKVNRRTLTPSNICRDVVHNVINTIRSNGSQAKVFRTPIDSTGVSLNDSNWHTGQYAYNSGGVQSEVGALTNLSGTRWPAVKSIYWQSGSGNYVVHSPLLIQGAINGLLSIYNAPGNAVCLQSKGVEITSSGVLKDFAPRPTIDNHSVKAFLKIRPFNLNTGEILPCAAPLAIRPYARTEPPPAQQMGIANFGAYRGDRGLEVEVFVETTSTDPTIKDHPPRSHCSIKERFQFDRQSIRPPAPQVQISGSRIRFSLPFDRFDPGTHLICRETHYFFGNRNSEASRAVSQYGTGGTPATPGPWVPCDRLSVCGNYGVAQVERNTATITSQFSMPPNCITKVEARTFDVAGNLSDVKPVNSYAGNPTSPPVYQPSEPGSESSSSPEAPRSYEVGGIPFRTQAAAMRASAISGLPLTETAEVAFGRDAEMNATSAGLSGATAARNQAGQFAAAAQGALNQAGGAAAAASGPGATGASAEGAAQQAEAAASQASSAASAARDAANRAVEAYQNTINASSNLGPIGRAAVEQAKAAYEEALKQATAAEKAAAEAKRLAEEARRAAEEKKRQEEEANDDDDDDDEFD